MRFPVFVALVVSVGACASPKAPIEPSPAKVAAEQVTTGFRTAVVDVCLAAAMAGTPVGNFATETGPIEVETNATLVKLAKPQKGDEVWSSRAAKGTVVIRSNGRECQVSAMGPPVKATLDAVKQALNDPHGFVPDNSAEPKAANNYQRFSKKVGARTFYVTLSGTEAGAKEHYSMLTATVTASPAAA